MSVRTVKKFVVFFFLNADKQLKLGLILAKRAAQTFEMGIAVLICPGLWAAVWGWGWMGTSSHGVQEHHQGQP